MFTCFLFFTETSLGQPSTSFNSDSLSRREANSLKEKLSLNVIQTNEVRIATKSYKEKIDSIRQLNVDTTEKRNLLSIMLHTYRHKLKLIFTVNQFTMYKNLIKQRRNTVKQWAESHNYKIKEIEDNY